MAKEGRPTDYRKEYAEQAYKLCLLGATNDELADFFDVATSTIHYWRNNFPQFSDAIKRGKEKADAEVAQSLYRRALGYSHEEEKVFNNNGEIVTHITNKHYPPDTAAAFIWLKNRQPNKWRDKHEITGENGEPLHFTVEYVSKEKAGENEPENTN